MSIIRSVDKLDNVPSTAEYDSWTSMIWGGPGGPTSRRGVLGWLILFSRSATLGLRTSVLGRRRCINRSYSSIDKVVFPSFIFFIFFYLFIYFFFVSSIESFRKKANKQQRIKCATFPHSYLRRRFPRLNNYSDIIRWIGRKLRLGSIFGCISCRMLCAVVPWMINHAFKLQTV